MFALFILLVIARLLLLAICLTLSLGSIILFHAHASAAQRHPAGSPPPVSAVSKIWYFADGRVGAGFQEYGHTYTQDIHVYGKSRSTVDITALVRDQLVQPNDDSSAYQVSMSVKSTGGAPFVAERPMYFNPNTLGIQGGTDVIGFAFSPPICAELNTSLGNGIAYITAGPDGNIWATELNTGKLGRCIVIY